VEAPGVAPHLIELGYIPVGNSPETLAKIISNGSFVLGPVYDMTWPTLQGGASKMNPTLVSLAYLLVAEDRIEDELLHHRCQPQNRQLLDHLAERLRVVANSWQHNGAPAKWQPPAEAPGHCILWRIQIAANVLDRSFEAPAPDRKWIADFTYVWTAEGWLYVAAVVDLFSRRVVGWSMSAAMTAQLVTDALVMAIWRRGKPDALLHHSDRGSQYTSEQFQRLMADHGVVCSMSRSGNIWDNAAMESFFSSLKTERTARKTHRTRDDAKAEVFDYIECFYNPKRRHSTIGYLSPVEFEMKAGLA
jgi:putative transposase